MIVNYSKEFQAIVEAYKKAGGSENALKSKNTGSLVINQNRVLGKNEVPGLHIKHKTTKNGVKVKVFIDKKTRLENAIHLCFGMLPQEGKQVIDSEFFIGEGAKVKFLAHCSFPNAKRIEHIMDSKVHIGRNAKMEYVEEHYHSESGGTLVYPKLRGKIEEGGKLFEEFRLTNGRAGVLGIDYEIEQGKKSSCELTTKVYGRGKDRIEVKESLYLNGEHAAGIAKSRIVLVDNAFGNVLGEITANAPYARGHVDCHEVIHGKGAKASSTPKISVKNPLASITHEAAIGRINKKELETLMARGLTKSEAVNTIVTGLLK